MKEKNNKLSEVLIYLEDIIKKRSMTKEKSYTSDLLAKGIDRISQKVGEEAIEVVIASNKKQKKQVVYESADLIFHLLVLWKKLNINNNEIANELLKRKK
jgi:phosphoribosyl-ATP pyrophosphohydrolase